MLPLSRHQRIFFCLWQPELVKPLLSVDSRKKAPNVVFSKFLAKGKRTCLPGTKLNVGSNQSGPHSTHLLGSLCILVGDAGDQVAMEKAPPVPLSKRHTVGRSEGLKDLDKPSRGIALPSVICGRGPAIPGLVAHLKFWARHQEPARAVPRQDNSV